MTELPGVHINYFTLGDAKRRELFYLISIISTHSFNFYHIYSFLYLFTKQIFTEHLCHAISQAYKNERREADMSQHCSEKPHPDRPRA